MLTELTILKLSAAVAYPDVRDYYPTRLEVPTTCLGLTVLAGQAIAASYGDAWHNRGLNPLRYGDVLKVNNRDYMLIPTEENRGSPVGSFPRFSIIDA